jgi:FkbM family methyltransferase
MPSYPNPRFDPNVHAERVQHWQAGNCDERFRTTYDCLTPDSIVLDLGGYNGDFALLMNAKYGATCHVFEVNSAWCDRIRARSQGNEKIIIHPFGLAGSARREKLFLVDEGSSTFCDRSSKSEMINIDLVKASDWFESELGTAPVGLAKINIEGGEYELLEHLLDAGITHRIHNIQVQFHEDVIPDANERMRAIHDKLSATHRLTFQELFIWENWELR